MNALLMKLFVCTPLILIAAASSLAAQTPPALPPAQHRVYDHLFLQITAVEKAADDADGKNDHGNADKLRKHFQNQIGLKDDETAKLKSHAKACAKQVSDQDDKAADIVKRERAKNPGGKMPQGQKPPAAPPELDQMWTARIQMINDHVTGLKQDLGADTFSKVDQFAKVNYAHVKVKPIMPTKRPQGAPSAPPH